MTHTALSRVALRLFRTGGFRATSVADIATAAGIGRSTFFNYFGSKQDIMWGCAERQLAALELRLAAHDPEGDPFALAGRTLVALAEEIEPEDADLTVDHSAVLRAEPELLEISRGYAERRAELLTGFLASRLPDTAETLAHGAARAMTGAVEGAVLAFAGGGGRRRTLSEYIGETVLPVCTGFTMIDGRSVR